MVSEATIETNEHFFKHYNIYKIQQKQSNDSLLLMQFYAIDRQLQQVMSYRYQDVDICINFYEVAPYSKVIITILLAEVTILSICSSHDFYIQQLLIYNYISMQQQEQLQPTSNHLELKQTTPNEKLLLLKIEKLENQNKRLKTRIAEIEPHKQKKLRLPNQQKIEELFEIFQIKKFAIKVCYLGFSYDGMAYQKMNDDNTIEAFIFKALYTMSLIKNPLPGEDYTRAGRTDKGVSAFGNVISLRLRSNLPKKLSQSSQSNHHKKIQYCSMLNAILPEDIRILACTEVTDDFNARYWCTKRSYKYFFVKNNLNIEVMKSAIKSFIGTHNFINYCKMNLTNTVNFERTIFSAEIVKSQVNEVFQCDTNQVYYFHFIGNSFLWHQIRFMSSILFLIGSGQQKQSLVSQLLDINKYPTKPNYPMSPQYPLILCNCQYPKLDLESDMKTTISFYKIFNEIVMKKSTEKTLVINCIMMAQRDLMASRKITEQYFIEQYKKQNNKLINKKLLSMHKSSGRSFEQAQNSLKGKKLEVFKKKMRKQEQFEQKQKEKRLREGKITEKEQNNLGEPNQQDGNKDGDVDEDFQ